MPCNNFSVVVNTFIDTADTTRVMGQNPAEFNTYVTRMIYPSADVEWRPNAVILVPLTTFHYALAASPIIHFPTNAPLLFTNPDFMSPETFREISRLSPTGINVPAKVIIVGPVSYSIEMQLRNLGISTVRVGGYDPVFTAAEALEFRYTSLPESKTGRDNIMVVPVEKPDECLHAAYFSAHMGTPILFAKRDSLPDLTRQKLIKYKDKNVFVIASENGISNGVLNDIKGIVRGKVDRIGGNTPYERTVNFSRYYSEEGEFGWNINSRDGWAFAFGTPMDWPNCLSACIFAHLGKHSSLLFIEPDMVPDEIKSYVLSLNPMETHPPKPPYMHGYILGGFDRISYRAQIELEKILIRGAGKH